MFFKKKPEFPTDDTSVETTNNAQEIHYKSLLEEYETESKRVINEYDEALSKHDHDALSIILCGNTLKYTIVSTTVHYPSYLLSGYKRLSLHNLEYAIDRIKREIKYLKECVIRTEKEKEYASFWTYEEAEQHLPIVQKNMDAWRKENKNGND